MINKVPDIYKTASLDSKTDTDSLKQVKAVFTKDGLSSESIGKCLVISGPSGCGKTYALWAAFNVLDEKSFYENWCSRKGPYKGIYGEVIYFGWFGDYHNASLEEKRDMIYSARTAPVLFIDDLGAERLSENSLTLFEDIIDYRYSNRDRAKITIILTNLTAVKFKERYSERIVDRLREWGTFFATDEPSLRKGAGL